MLLTGSQIDLLEPLGLRSGRGETTPQGKLASLDFRLTDAGDPYFVGGSGYVDCVVIDAFDLGDCTAFLVAVHKDERLTSTEPVTWKRASELGGRLRPALRGTVPRRQGAGGKPMRWY